ncbi:MAG TPA: hypothetical protein VGK17_13715 [Propionicimonas sp.]
MTDTTSERAGARAAMTAPVAAPDVRLLGAVHHGLLTVPVDVPEHDGSAGQGSVRDASVRNGSLRDASVRDASARDGSLRNGSVRDDALPQLAVRTRGVI